MVTEMINPYQIKANSRFIYKIVLLSLGLGLFLTSTGCSGNYGRLQRNSDVFQAFESNQVSPEYRYYYNGVSFTYAIVGIDPKYKIQSKFWKVVEPNTDEFKLMITRIWEDYGFRRYGANILDPNGQQIGIFYSSIYVVTVKFVGDDEILILLDSPYLWGPDLATGGNGIRVR
jgi:hypothetical protein